MGSVSDKIISRWQMVEEKAEKIFFFKVEKQILSCKQVKRQSCSVTIGGHGREAVLMEEGKSSLQSLWSSP